MRLVTFRRELVAPRALHALRMRLGSGARAMMLLIVGFTLFMPSTRGGPGMGSDRTTDDPPAKLTEKPKDNPRGALAQDGADDPIPTRGLTQPIGLDLRTDPRKLCQVEGPVEWEPGKLTLGPKGSIRQGLAVGDQSKLTMRLGFSPLTEDGQTSTTRFAYQVRDRGEFVVRVLRRREGGKTRAQVQLIDQDTPDLGEKRTQTLRAFDWDGDFPDERWTFQLHHGLMSVYVGNTRLAIGYADKEPTRLSDRFYLPPKDQWFFEVYGLGMPLDVSGWSLDQDGTPLACHQVSGSASLSDVKATFAQSNINVVLRDPERDFRRVPFTRAMPVRDMIDHPVDDAQTKISTRGGHLGPFRDESDQDAGFRRNRNLGERHPYYALVLTAWGMQYHWAGKDAVAERLLKQATEIGAKSLGPSHPDHALIVSALAQVYRDMGKIEQAEPLMTEAARIVVEAFGPRSYRANPARRQLAVLHQDFGRFAEAETLLRRAVEAGADAPPRERGDALAALGELDARIGEREKAAALLGEAQDLLEKEYLRLKSKASLVNTVMPVAVSLDDVKVQHAWVLFQGGKKDAARQLARATFLQMCQFENVFGVNGQGRFPGWNSWMRDVRPNGLARKYPLYRQAMLALARLFLALGDLFPALGCIQVLDMVPGQSHHDLATIYRIMSKVRETHPQGLVTAYVDVEHIPERWIREKQYEQWSLDKKRKPDERRPEPDVYWLELALKEYEQSVGRDHPDTLDALQARARQQWLYGGPEKAEPTLRDAWSRAVDLSDKVLPGLPEVQTYQFLEVHRPPADLMLSLYRATKQDHAREAYEVVWRSKALATRQVAERRQLAQAASGRPEIARLADELQGTRQSLARVSLSVPTGNVVEPRRQQLAALTGRKEDLERELARQSEPFRRARDAERATIAELVRRLPARTVIVDLTERWEWTPPPPVTADDRPPPAPPSNLPPAAAQKKAAPAQQKNAAAQKKKAAVRKNGASQQPPPPARPAPPPPRAAKPWERKRRYDAFVLRPDQGEPGWSAQWLELGDADTLDHLLDGWIAGVRPGGRADHALAQQLRDRLWKPIELALGDCRTVILIPDGRLAQVPWNALPGKRPGSYLIEDFALVQAPYGQYIARILTDPPQTGNGFLLVGGIDYGPSGGKWPFLKGTAAEVEQLAKLRPEPDTVRLDGPSATQSRLRELMPGRRFIHLATHGEFLDPGPGQAAESFRFTDNGAGGASFDVTARNPLVLSKLVLAGANRPVEVDPAGVPVGDDGFLTAEEVMGMDLSQNELVVLSACETGAGKVRGGEGVFSLQRAFHVAGSRAVVASLWAVDDRATQALMGRFYQDLWSNAGQSKGKLDALREAQLWLIREGAEELGRTRGGLERPDPELRGTLPPSYWAAFVLSGDWR